MLTFIQWLSSVLVPESHGKGLFQVIDSRVSLF